MKNIILQKAILTILTGSSLLLETDIVRAYSVELDQNRSNKEATLIASSRCQVTDPTGTPLNVRSQPNGRIINALKNGSEINIDRIAYDNKDRPWAYISGYYNGQYRDWGWVYKNFLTCTNQVNNSFNDFKYKTKAKDSLTFNEFKRIIRTANDNDFIELGKFGNIAMPDYYSVHKSSIRHLGGGYYGAVVKMYSNPIHLAEYIEFHSINQNSIVQVFSGGAGRSSQFSNWSYEEVNESLAIDDTPYFDSLLNILKTEIR